jgi:quinol monooxygenase YgiN
MPSSATISLFRARPGFSLDLGRWLDRLAEASRSERDCRFYAVHRADNDPDLWIVYEQWRSADAAIAHLAQPHVGACVDAIAPLLIGDVGISSFTGLSPEDRLAA